MHSTAIRSVVVIALVTTGLVGCTPTTDPVVEKILAADLGQLTAVSDEVKGYCYPTELFCSNPIFEPAFSAPAEADPAGICNAVIDLQIEIGLVAYSTEGELANKVTNPDEVRDQCTTGLSQALEAEDGSTYYQGTVLFDDGATDGVGKVTVISRTEDGYFVVFSVSRNLDRVGWISYENQP
ncbi:MAG: hypothetical protein RIR89_1316 [Actinomycetota bacterium]|jgi:hypothetical protein